MTSKPFNLLFNQIQNTKRGWKMGDYDRNSLMDNEMRGDNVDRSGLGCGGYLLVLYYSHCSISSNIFINKIRRTRRIYINLYSYYLGSYKISNSSY